MAVLTELPCELLEQIYHHLGSIDDVHHLGRACRPAHHVIQRQSSYVEIMRSIITQAPQHRYDIQLCKMLKLHGNIVSHFERGGHHFPATLSTPLGHSLNEWEEALVLATASPDRSSDVRLCAGCLPDETVYEILARYQGLRILQDMWLERQLNESDYLPADKSVNENRLLRSYQILISRGEEFRDGCIFARSSKTPETQTYTSFNDDQRGRFHAATTCVWLLNEIRWVLTNFIYPARFNVQIYLLEDCLQQFMTEDKSKMLLDELDQNTVFRFIYHHLLPLYGTFLADRDSSKFPLTFSTEFTKDTVHCVRLLQLFLMAGQTYLQPPDLIELAVRSKASRQPPYPLLQLPLSTEMWFFPTQFFPLPTNTDLCDDRYKSLFVRASLTYLSIINRSSFHQTRYNTSQDDINAPLHNQPALYAIQDHAGAYFADRMFVAFELSERQGKELRNIREVLPKAWDRIVWSVWWWANSEEKARAKMERLRERQREHRVPRS